MKKKALQAAQFIKQRIHAKPNIGVILGTGLGKLVNIISIEKTFQYNEIPHFPVSTVEFHKGRLLVGSLYKKKVVAMQGRFHYYEGYSAQDISFPVVVMKLLGIRYLIVSNASGGLNPDFTPGDIMLITDHINLIPDNPLRGKNELKMGPRFPDLYDCYSSKLRTIAEDVALKRKIRVKKGVYVAVPGPNLETRAEYRFLRAIGADAVGMSTVPEVLMARYLKIKVLGLSIITDMGIADALKPASLIKILNAARRAEPKLTRIASGVIEKI